MVVFKATLLFAIAALGILVMGNQAVSQRNPITQKLPTFGDGDPCWSCKNLEEDQKVENNLVVIWNSHFKLDKLEIINLLRLLLNPTMNNPDMPKKHTAMVGKRSEMEILGRQSGAHSEQDHDKDEEYGRKNLEEKPFVLDQGQDQDQKDEHYGRMKSEEKPYVPDQGQAQDQKDEYYGRKKVEDNPFGGEHLFQDQHKENGRGKVEEKQGRENPLGLAAWRKKMLRRMG